MRPKNAGILNRIEQNISAFEAERRDELGQKVEWKRRGKGSGNNAILTVWYRDRANQEESKDEWAEKMIPRFLACIRSYAIG